MKLRTLAIAILAPAMALTGAACGGDSGQTTSASGKKLTKVTLTLNWYPYGEHAPFYYGKKKGIYEKHGIDLEIKAGQGSQKTVQATGAGQTDFGWADTPALLAAVDKGMPVKSVGVFLQTTPASVQSFTTAGIKKPADLKGKKIAGTAGDALARTFPVFLKKNGLSEGDVPVQNTDPAGKMAAVLAGKTAGLMGFANDQGPTMAAKSGKEVSYLRYSDFGLNFFSNGLIVGERKLKSDADLVKDMVAATSESWTAAEGDQAGAVASMAGASEQLPPTKVVTEQFKTTLSLLHTPATQGKAPGVNAEADWKTTIATFQQAGVIEKAQPPSEYWQASAAPQA
ncbi:sulfonate ABC transporter substrate-binding protein [Actinomadura darangshiensis]|uniref:Sulfonate ABC transporter substrate-binding protein n=1 Tax=Actinomadura darangshiensis TaxID=705336 RepID=A0A4R5A2Z1_9ACTN|nr:ABC transporter substrate-binding protein [Actinomadura darangshiensis]TDD65835.1 sulfonate ABC transporter substrate-binding protein [Actinomadura darangshiensis]